MKAIEEDDRKIELRKLELKKQTEADPERVEDSQERHDSDDERERALIGKPGMCLDYWSGYWGGLDTEALRPSGSKRQRDPSAAWSGATKRQRFREASPLRLPTEVMPLDEFPQVVRGPHPPLKQILYPSSTRQFEINWTPP